MQQPLAYIPSPSRGLIHLGPLPLRGYALMIILGVVVAVWLGERRWAARGGTPGTVIDVAVWAVPFGLVGGRLYHVITDYQLYFGDEMHVARVFEVWKGGLGIWGAIAAGALGAYLGCRRRGVSLRTFADAAAPGIALAQALGRWGNWFNQELYGKPTKLPWAVEIDPAHRVSTPDVGTYHPTFLYESLWCVGVAVLVIWAEKRFRLAYGRTFALYVAAYTVGRAWIEWLRVDSAHHILGLRLNDWTSLIVFLAAVAYLYHYRDRTEIPEGAVGHPVPEPGGEPTAAGESAPASEDPDATAKESVGKADSAGKAGESEAASEGPEATDTSETVKASGGEPEKAAATAEPEASESATSSPSPATDAAKAEKPAAAPPAAKTGEDGTDTHGEPAKRASADPASTTGRPVEASATGKPTATGETGGPGEPSANAGPAATGRADGSGAPSKDAEPAATAKADESGETAESAEASTADEAGASAKTGRWRKAGRAAKGGRAGKQSETRESESEAADPADEGKDDGRATASTGGEPGERKS